jgi:hypothetical protein
MMLHRRLGVLARCGIRATILSTGLCLCHGAIGQQGDVSTPEDLGAGLLGADHLIADHLAAGEFVSARKMIDQREGRGREIGHLQLATSLEANGLGRQAAAELGRVQDPDLLRTALRSRSSGPGAALFGNRRGDVGRVAGGNGLGDIVFGNGSQGGYGDGATGSGVGLPNDGSGDSRGAGAAGGGAIADFDSLMQLIQTTVAPDSWDTVGGPSTMFPYRSGIYVDAEGLVRDVQVDSGDRLASLRNATSIEAPRWSVTENSDWTAPANQRVVSLRRLRDAYRRQVADGLDPTLAMQNLAGLSEIRYVIVESDDLLLVGTVGGIDPAASPWPRDRATGMTTLGLDLLVASAAAVRDHAAYGCSIDPTPEGMEAAAATAAKIANREIPPATAATALATALGPQNILLFDIPTDQPLAWLLVDADRHMKQLALGLHPMPPGVLNYLDVVERSTRQSPENGIPNGQLLRMWFAVQPKQVRRAAGSLTFEMEGRPIRLATAKEIFDDAGQRQQAGNDPIGKAFAEEFNRHFDSIAATYPVYDRLRGAFELTAAMQLVLSQTDAETYQRLISEFAIPEWMFAGTVNTPKFCDSVAVRHTIRTPRQRHEVYIVSGGIKIDPEESLVSKIDTYPVLDNLGIASSDAPPQNTRWWWDR